MLKYIRTYLNPLKHEQLNLLQMEQYVRNIENKISEYLIRTYRMVRGNESSGLDYLMKILYKSGLNDLDKLTSIIDQLFYIQNYLLDMYESYFSTGDASNIIRTNDFIKDTQSFINTTEIIIPIVESYDIQLYSPYIENYKKIILNRTKKNKLNEVNNNVEILNNYDLILYENNKNIKLRPFWMIYNDSRELTLTIKNMKLEYSYDQPSTVIFTLQLEKLIIGACYFLKQYGEESYMYQYLFQYCLLPVLMDTGNNYLISIIDYLIKRRLEMNKDMKMNDIDLSLFGNISSLYRWIRTSGLERGIKDIINAINLVASRNITPEGFLNNIPLLWGMNLLNFNDFILNDNNIMDTQNNRWLIFMRDLNIFNLIFDLYQLVPTYNNTKSIMRRLVSIMRNYKTSRFWNKCRDIVLRKHIKEEIDRILEFCKEYS